MIKISQLPEENEIVVGIIRKILPYGAFCSLTEYNNLEAFLHISEVAPRWIKNIHEFISEGQSHVLKVHHIDQVKKQVDVSLKRVNEQEKKAKLANIRDEKKIKKLLEVAINNSKLKLTVEEIRQKIDDKFDIYSFFELIAEDPKVIEDVDIPKGLKTELLEIAKKSVKKAVIEVRKLIKLSCYSGDGIEVVKKALKPYKDRLEIIYLGAPNYQIALKAKAFKEGEKEIGKILAEMEKFASKNDCDFSVDEEQ